MDTAKCDTARLRAGSHAGQRWLAWTFIAMAMAMAACSRAPEAESAPATAPGRLLAPRPAPPASPPAPVRVMPSADLAESQWTLRLLRGAALLAGSHVNLDIGRDRMGGYDGCNWYGVKYRDMPTGNPRTFQLLGGVESSARGCESDAHLQQSRQYFSALGAAVELRVQGQRLLALDRDETPLLEFARVPRFAMDPRMLHGSNWRLQAIDDASRAHTAGQAITLRFGEKSLRGHAGCRDYTASYHAHNDLLAVPSLAMATLACADPAALRREGAFTTLLSETSRYRLDRQVLTLFTSTGHRLQFVPCDDCAE